MKITSILFFLIAMATSFSCNKKDDFNYPPGKVGISKITYFALLSLSGDQYMSVVQGQSFTDPGCTATVNGASVPVTTSGSVDINTVGLYVVTYSAVNADGYAASTSRTVAVLPSAETAGVDISGSYYYVSTGANNSTVTKVAPGFYSTTNCWSSGTSIPILFICVDGANIIIPNQTTGYGPVEGTGSLTPGGALTYVVSLLAYGINNSARHWHLQ